MERSPFHELFLALFHEPVGGSDPAQFETAEPLPPEAGPLLPEEQDGERDLGSLDLPEEYEEMYERSFYHPYG